MGPGLVHSGVPRRGYMAAPWSRARRAYVLFDVQMAFVVLGIGLAGLCPLVVMQLRQVRMLEMRLRGQVIETSRVTGVSRAMVITSAIPCDPGPLNAGSTTPQNTVSIVGPLTFPNSQSVTAYVDITSIP
jgi:hypothetical protein